MAPVFMIRREMSGNGFRIGIVLKRMQFMQCTDKQSAQQVQAITLILKSHMQRNEVREGDLSSVMTNSVQVFAKCLHENKSGYRVGHSGFRSVKPN